MTNFKHFITVIACITYLTVQINGVSAQNWPPHINMNGDGLTAATAWEITTISELFALADYVNAGNGTLTAGVYFKLMNDIDYNYSIIQPMFGWDPIGNNPVNDAIFQGNFDGNSKVISNITIKRRSDSYVGLFGYISNSNIYNFGIKDCDISGDNCVGGLVGYAVNSTIERCYVIGSVSGVRVGGLIGESDNSTISNCYANCEVSGYCSIGGLIGLNFGNIEKSYSDGNITTEGYFETVGGFVGRNLKNINNCYAKGIIVGESTTFGGFAGENYGSISDCYATCNITGILVEFSIGGLVGSNAKGAIIQNCVAANSSITGGVYDVNRVSGNYSGNNYNNYAFDGMIINSNGGDPGTGKSMDTLMSFDFYNTGSNWFNAPWSIDTIDNPLKSWKICDGMSLPFLQWEGIVCNPVDPCDTFQDGSANFPFLICTVQDLENLVAVVNMGVPSATVGLYWKVMNDLELQGINWIPIGNSVRSFQGNFDGNGKVISNLTINKSSSLIGLFGSTTNASIHDVIIENFNINGVGYSGSLIGESNTSNIDNCNSTGTIVGSSYYVGGLIGHSISSTITNCHVFGNASGTTMLGLLVGRCSDSTIVNNCYTIGYLSGASTIGGLVGGIYPLDANYILPSIFNSYSNCGVTGTGGSCAGLVGGSTGIIENCYATGNVSGYRNVGGLVGISNDPGYINNSYAIGNVNGDYMYIGGLVGWCNSNISYSYAQGNVTGINSTTYVGGLVGDISNYNIFNCVAANSSVKGGKSFINRISGSNTGTFSNNYAYNGMVITPFGGNSGISASMNTLMSFNFYNSGSNWFNAPWSIDITDNSSVIWGICDDETLPFFQWQGFNCSSKSYYAGYNNKSLIEELNGESSLFVFPNPASNNITISSIRNFQK